MAIMTYRVEFVGKAGFPEFLARSKMIQRIHMNLRSMAVNALNPRYSEWNESYSEDDGDYSEYIVARQNEVLDELFRNSSRIRIRTLVEEVGDLCMTIKGVPGYLTILLHED